MKGSDDSVKPLWLVRVERPGFSTTCCEPRSQELPPARRDSGGDCEVELSFFSYQRRGIGQYISCLYSVGFRECSVKESALATGGLLLAGSPHRKRSLSNLLKVLVKGKLLVHRSCRLPKKVLGVGSGDCSLSLTMMTVDSQQREKQSRVDKEVSNSQSCNAMSKEEVKL